MQDLIRQILSSPAKGVLAVTGGGVGGLYELLRYGGASSLVLECVVPYAKEAFQDFTKANPEKFVSDEGARLLASRAHSRAMELAEDVPVFGLGLSCTLARHENERAGREHQVFIAYHDDTSAISWSFLLTPCTRANQEEVVAKLLVATLANALGFSESSHKLLATIQTRYQQRGSVVHSNYSGFRNLLTSTNQPDFIPPLSQGPASPMVVVPGSFNPLHDGHIKLAQIASEMTGLPAIFEMSITNVDKPTLDIHAIHSRVTQFKERGLSLAVTRAATFLEKTFIFPKCTFAVGIDTWNRLNDVRYHQNDPLRLQEMRAAMSVLGIKFLVFGRKVGDQFQTLSWNDPLATAVPESKFRLDISSTELRKKL